MENIAFRSRIAHPLTLVGVLILAGVVAAFAPLEKTLGATARLIYLHGAWVETGKAAFGLAALAGLGALVSRRQAWYDACLALGRAGLTFWLTYLPMSLLVMQLNWGGFFFDEPRWKIPFAFAVAGVLLQAGLTLMKNPWLTALANLAYGAALWIILGVTGNVLHPDSPIFGSADAGRIQVYFIILLALTLLAGLLTALQWFKIERRKGSS